MKKYRIPARIPPAFFQDILDENDLITVILEHIDYYLRLNGQKSSFGYAAYTISRLKEPLSNIHTGLTKIKGIGKSTEDVIKEVLNTGKSTLLERLMGD